jgi:hypothetical protein
LVRTERHPKGDGDLAAEVLFVEPATGRRLRSLEIYEDCDPEWRDYGGPSTVNGIPFDEWDNAVAVSSLN